MTRLKELMKEKKISAKALAARIGMPLGTLRNYVQGRTSILSMKVSTAVEIAIILNCESLDDMIGTDIEPARREFSTT